MKTLKQFLKLFMIGFCCLITPVSLHAAIKPNKTAVYIKKGDSTAIQITGAKSKVKWSSTNKNVASVTSTGKYTGSIKGINSGNAVIKSTDGKTSAKTNVYVMSITHSSLELTPSESASLSITNRNNGTVTWKSSNAKVAKVSSAGKVTAVAGGTATITGTCRGKSWTCKIYVPILSLKSSTITVGKTTTASVSSHISTIKYSSSNKSVATVTSAGTVKGIAAGTATITAKGYNSSNRCITQLSRTIKVQKAINPKNEMISLLSELKTYAHGKNANFSMITNGGYGLYCPTVNTSATSRSKFFNAVDGVLIEEVFYGWDGKMNKATPGKDQKEMLSAFLAAKNAGKPCFVLDYCTGNNAQKSFKSSSEKGLISYASPSRELDVCPSLPVARVNNENSSQLSDVKNYLIILNPRKFSDKKTYLNSIRNSNYDMVFIDLFYNGEELEKEDVDSLKTKPNGKKRKICTYISIGEAEDYRDYWKSSWDISKPSWIDKENPEWERNYKVKFWETAWKKLLYGNDNAYLDRAIKAGFDGAYLDVIDAYEYFE